MNTHVQTIPARNAFSRAQGRERAKDYRKVEVLSSYSRLSIPGLDWVILAEIDYQEAVSSINGIRNKIILFGIFTALAFFILTYVISSRITRPLVKLKEAVVDMGEGKLETALSVSSSDEIGELTEAFNLMANS
ncbi:MAG TPA: methyl-accepting chemotaxis protein, partial [Bacteroidales bacterium]|nr:methyl-accepting chemotaxis protein [Bacteroidales bacterium]